MNCKILFGFIFVFEVYIRMRDRKNGTKSCQTTEEQFQKQRSTGGSLLRHSCVTVRVWQTNTSAQCDNYERKLCKTPQTTEAITMNDCSRMTSSKVMTICSGERTREGQRFIQSVNRAINVNSSLNISWA